MKIKKFEEIPEKPKSSQNIKNPKRKEDSLFGSCFIEIFQEEEISISCEKEKIPKILQVLIILQSPSVEDPNVPKISTKACAISKPCPKPRYNPLCLLLI